MSGFAFKINWDNGPRPRYDAKKGQYIVSG